MKKKYFIVIIVIILLPVVNLIAGDPLSSSYILDSLEMETDKAPEGISDEQIKGEIIFDDDFFENKKNFSGDKSLQPPAKKQKKRDPFKEMKSRDSRWHLVSYRVKRDDNLWDISREFNVKSKDIIDINSISDPSKLIPGMVLKIPSREGIYYRIRRGDSLGIIAKRYGIRLSQIRNANGIRGNRIYAGKRLFLPGAVEKQKSIPSIERKIRKRTVVAKHNPVRTRRTGRESEKKGLGEKYSPLMNKTIIESKERAKKDKRLALSWPLKGPITSAFGYRKHPFTGENRFHCGLDIGANIGTNVRAAGNGRVIFSGWKGAYGNVVVVAHKNDYITVYAHNSKVKVRTNDTVRRGQIIAQSGKTGAVTGAHLHFEVRKGVIPLNPRRFLTR